MIVFSDKPHSTVQFVHVSSLHCPLTNYDNYVMVHSTVHEYKFLTENVRTPCIISNVSAFRVMDPWMRAKYEKKRLATSFVKKFIM